MERRTPPSNSKAGSASRKVLVTGDCTFRCSGYRPMPAFLDQLEIWFSVLQRKHLQPNHFLSTKDLERSLNEFIAYHNQAAKPIKWTYTVEKLEQKLGSQL